MIILKWKADLVTTVVETFWRVVVNFRKIIQISQSSILSDPWQPLRPHFLKLLSALILFSAFQADLLVAPKMRKTSFCLQSLYLVFFLFMEYSIPRYSYAFFLTLDLCSNSSLEKCFLSTLSTVATHSLCFVFLLIFCLPKD